MDWDVLNFVCMFVIDYIDVSKNFRKVFSHYFYPCIVTEHMHATHNEQKTKQ